jgi:hypothetical protein
MALKCALFVCCVGGDQQLGVGQAASQALPDLDAFGEVIRVKVHGHCA